MYLIRLFDFLNIFPDIVSKFFKLSDSLFGTKFSFDFDPIKFLIDYRFCRNFPGVRPLAAQEILDDSDLEDCLDSHQWHIRCPKCDHHNLASNLRDCDRYFIPCKECLNTIFIRRFNDVLSVEIWGEEAKLRTDRYTEHCIAGAKYGTEGNFIKAKEEFNYALQQYKNDIGAIFSLELVGDVLRQKIRDETAIALFTAASYAEGNNLKRAIAEVETALQLNPSYVISLETLAGFYEKQSDLNKAIEIQKRAISAEPNRAVSYYNLGVKYQRMLSDIENGIGNFITYQHLDRESFNRIHASFCNEMHQQYLEAIKRDPNFGPAHNNLAFYYRDQGNYPLMIEHRNMAINSGWVVKLEALYKR